MHRDRNDLTGGEAHHSPDTSRIDHGGLGDRGNIYFAAVEMTRMPMVVTDPNLPDNPIVFCNGAFVDLTGYEEEEVVGRNCRFLQGANTDPGAVADMRHAIAERRAVQVDVLNYKRDGTPFWNAVFIGPVFDGADNLLYYFASQLDITRRQAAEQGLRHAQKMESIGQLTAGLAHDFNNLLQVIGGNLEMLASSPLDEGQNRKLERARTAAARAAKLTRQLLAFARKTRLDAKPEDVNHVLRGFDDLMHAAVGVGFPIRYDLAEGLPLVHVDATHLEMAMMNLLLNARDSSPPGSEAVVTTRLRQVEDGGPDDLRTGSYIEIAVADRGAGMPEWVRDRAVEPFFTTKEGGRGTGLGLAMVHGFAKQSLGRLEIDSEPGRGTTMRLLFPTASGPSLERLVTDERRANEPRGESELILVVEDSEDVRKLAEEYLASLGYRVRCAVDADDALAVLDELDWGIDLLFSDLVMPGSMNGLALAERFAERRPELPILLTTGYNEDLLVGGKAPGGADVLGKPYRRSELADRVNRALNGKRRAHGGPPAAGRMGAPHKEG